MKAKLLKKIRKEYEIYEIISLASDAPNEQKEFVSKYGLPFFEVIHTTGDYHLMWNPDHFTSFQLAKDNILQWVLAKYSEKFRHKDGDRVKRWHLKNTK